MDLASTYTFNAPQQAVWDLLMDTTAIAGCVPGCRELRPIGEDRYQAELVVTVAAISGNFAATVAIEDKNAPQSYRLVVEGTARIGFVKGSAQIELEPGASGTIVKVAASAEVGGAVARVGQRLLEGVGRMTMDRFFACMASRLDRDRGA
jgi:carbon monoxide dehydrogenase subunit G